MEIKHINADWYRYKGDIKLKHLHVYKHVPFDTFSSNQIDKKQRKEITKITTYNETT